MPNPTEPGWYPDARHADVLRYWSGEGWTLKTKPNEAVAPSRPVTPTSVTPPRTAGPGRVLRPRAEPVAPTPVTPPAAVTPPAMPPRTRPAATPAAAPAYPGTHAPIPPASSSAPTPTSTPASTPAQHSQPAQPSQPVQPAAAFPPYPGTHAPIPPAANDGAAAPDAAMPPYPATSAYPTSAAYPTPAGSGQQDPRGPQRGMRQVAGTPAGPQHRSTAPSTPGSAAATEEYNEFWAGTAMYGPQLTAKVARVIRDNSAAGEMPWFVLQNAAGSGALVAFADRVLVLKIAKLTGVRTTILPFSQVASISFFGEGAVTALNVVSANANGTVTPVPLTAAEHSEALTELGRLAAMVGRTGGN